MPNLDEMLHENQTRLDRTLRRLERAGLPPSKFTTAREILSKLENAIKLPRKGRQHRSQSSEEMTRRIDRRSVQALYSLPHFF